MLYRENGQFKSTYRADQQIFPIAQDRWAVLAIIAFAFIGGYLGQALESYRASLAISERLLQSVVDGTNAVIPRRPRRSTASGPMTASTARIGIE